MNELNGLVVSGNAFRWPATTPVTKEFYEFEVYVKNGGTKKITFDTILFNLYDGRSIVIGENNTVWNLNPGQEIIVDFYTADNTVQLQKDSLIKIYVGFFRNNRRLDNDAAFRTTIPKLTDIPGLESLAENKLYTLDFEPVGVEMQRKI